jgi:hypothetical protein
MKDDKKKKQERTNEIWIGILACAVLVVAIAIKNGAFD